MNRIKNYNNKKYLEKVVHKNKLKEDEKGLYLSPFKKKPEPEEIDNPNYHGKRCGKPKKIQNPRYYPCSSRIMDSYLNFDINKFKTLKPRRNSNDNKKKATYTDPREVVLLEIVDYDHELLKTPEGRRSKKGQFWSVQKCSVRLYDHVEKFGVELPTNITEDDDHKEVIKKNAWLNSYTKNVAQCKHFLEFLGFGIKHVKTVQTLFNIFEYNDFSDLKVNTGTLAAYYFEFREKRLVKDSVVQIDFIKKSAKRYMKKIKKALYKLSGDGELSSDEDDQDVERDIQEAHKFLYGEGKYTNCIRKDYEDAVAYHEEITGEDYESDFTWKYKNYSCKCNQIK